MTKKTTVIGLTGSIGMGKSETLRLFKKRGAAYFSADETVHGLFSKKSPAFPKIKKAFPFAVHKGKIDRKTLGDALFEDEKNLRKLEDLLHPYVFREAKKKIKEAKSKKKKWIVLDIPLLFETRADRICDITVCVSAKAALQRKRVLQRPGMTPQKFRSILKRQIPDAQKRKKADFVLRTDESFADTEGQITLLLKRLSGDLDKTTSR